MTKQTVESCRAKNKVLNLTTGRCNKIIKRNGTQKLSILRKQCLEKKKIYDTKTKKCVNTSETCKAKGKVYNNKTKRCNKVKTVIERESCPICTEVLTRKGVIVTKCKHKFHIDCLEVWCRKNKNSTSCPMCRAPINDTCLTTHTKNKKKCLKKGVIKVFQEDIDKFRENDAHLPLDQEWVLQEDVYDLSKLFYRKLLSWEYKCIGISKWDVSRVQYMDRMFLGEKAFNEPLNNWDVSKVQVMGDMFEGAESFNQPLDRWNVSNVTTLRYMFYKAKAFNQPLEKWNVSKVTNMEHMFHDAEAFNQPLEKWNVSKVEDMKYMFSGTKAFNQSLEKWDVSNVRNMGHMFDGAEAIEQ